MPEYIERKAVRRMIPGLTRYSWKSPISAEHRSTVDVGDLYFGPCEIPAAPVVPELLQEEPQEATDTAA